MSNTEGTITDEIAVVVEGSGKLGTTVRARFTEAVRRYAVTVLEETSRVEFTQRGASATEPEYTSAQVDSAVRVVHNRGVAPRRRAWWIKLLWIVQPFLTVILGVAIAEGIREPGWLLPGGILFGVSIVVVAVLVIYDRGAPE